MDNQPSQPKKMKKMKWTFIIIIIIIFIIIAFFVINIGSGYKKTPTGWSIKPQWNSGFIDDIVYNLFGNMFCKARGGYFDCYPVCPPYGDYICEYALKDAGKKCTNSSQCQSKCIVDEDFMENKFDEMKKQNPGKYELWQTSFTIDSYECSDCEGKCAKYPTKECDVYYEFNNGLVIPYAQLCM